MFTLNELALPLIALKVIVAVLLVDTSSEVAPFTFEIVTVSVLVPLAAVSAGKLTAVERLLFRAPVQLMVPGVPPFNWYVMVHEFNVVVP